MQNYTRIGTMCALTGHDVHCEGGEVGDALGLAQLLLRLRLSTDNTVSVLGGGVQVVGLIHRIGHHLRVANVNN